MNKEIISLALALGCVGSIAATNNYDLLGRKGSKMHSPMVYKNVDYSKVKKNEQQKLNSSLENRSLAKVGLKGDVSALYGAYGTGNGYGGDALDENGNAYDSRGRKVKVTDAHYYLKRFYSNQSDENCNNFWRCVYEWNIYKRAQNQAFIDVKDYGQPYDQSFLDATGYYRHQNSPLVASNYPGFGYADWEQTTYQPFPGWSNVNSNRYTLELQPTPANYSADDYADFSDVNNNNLKFSSVSYIWNSTNPSQFDLNGTDVGVFLGADALPVQFAMGKFVGYIHNINRDAFDNPSPIDEVRSSRSHALITESSKYSVVYVGKDDPEDPAGRIPQIYIGVRNNKLKKGNTSSYSTAAKDLDNYIYQYRTAEFVPAGNYGLIGDLVNEQAQAANAITVGALDPFSGRELNYSSANTYANGSKKPEIYNYSNLVKTEDLIRRYSSISDWNYPLYDGTQMAAAYSAGMVSNLLARNPFYRWHPEVVKAYLLSSITSVPDYEYLFRETAMNEEYPFDSRFWNGDINKLKSRVNASNNNRKEIWVVTRNDNVTGRCPSKAAISWLSSGDDIANNNGKVPQDFDLYAYGCTEADCKNFADPRANMSNFNFNKSRPQLAASENGSKNSYEKVSITETAFDYPYLAFKIVLFSDNSKDNKDQIVLGFNYTTCDR